MFASPKLKFGDISLTGVSPPILQFINFSRSLTKSYLKFRSCLVIQFTNHCRKGQRYLGVGPPQKSGWMVVKGFLAPHWKALCRPFSSLVITVFTPFNILNMKPLRASLLQKQILMYPSFHSFWGFFPHQRLKPGVTVNVHPPTGGNSYCFEGKLLPKASSQESLGCQTCRIPGGAVGGLVLLRGPGTWGMELPCKCICLHKFLALRDSEVSYPIRHPCQDLQVKYWDWLSPFGIPLLSWVLSSWVLFLSLRPCVTKF